jgi:hypothetical protein
MPLKMSDSHGYDAVLEVQGNIIRFFRSERMISPESKKKPERFDKSHGSVYAFPDISGIVNRIYPPKKKQTPSSIEVEEAAARSEKESLRRARKKVSALVNINFALNSFFITLTFSSQIEITHAMEKIKIWLKAQSRKHKKLRYLWVLELQKSGRPHFHLIADGCPSHWELSALYAHRGGEKQGGIFEVFSQAEGFSSDLSTTRFLERGKPFPDGIRGEGIQVSKCSVLMREWGNGFADVKKLRSRDGGEIADVGAYLTKYMTKESALPKGCTRYGFSRGRLKQKGPLCYNEVAKEVLEFFLCSFKDKVWHESYMEGENTYLGKWQIRHMAFEKGFLPGFNGDGNGIVPDASLVYGEFLRFGVDTKEASNWPKQGITDKVLFDIRQGQEENS